jgi:hypothetical protein
MMRTKAVVLLLVLAAPLVFAGTALASYWFFQGYLPRPDGTRSVFLGYRPAAPVYVRTSWSLCNHNMNIVFIKTDHSWLVNPMDWGYGCDQEVEDYQYGLYINYGCSNPDGKSQVYDNCYAGTGP